MHVLSPTALFNRKLQRCFESAKAVGLGTLPGEVGAANGYARHTPPIRSKIHLLLPVHVEEHSQE